VAFRLLLASLRCTRVVGIRTPSDCAVLGLGSRADADAAHDSAVVWAGLQLLEVACDCPCIEG